MTPDHWFEDLADHLGSAYLRYSFTKGTEQEVGFLAEVLDLVPGRRVLDVGCGPGRHALALARRGVRVHGVDISQPFVDIARVAAEREGLDDLATFDRVDARRMAFASEFDAAISLCQGAFGLAAGGPDRRRGDVEPTVGVESTSNRRPAVVPDDPDGVVLAAMAQAVHPGAPMALSAFSSYFMVRHLPEHMHFDAALGVNHERTVIKDEHGAEVEADLWTSCFTPRELRLLASAAGMQVDHLWSVTPGAYGSNPPDLDHEELLLVGRRG